MKRLENMSDYHKRIIKTAVEAFFGTLASFTAARLSGVDMGNSAELKTFLFTALGSAVAAAITAAINLDKR